MIANHDLWLKYRDRPTLALRNALSEKYLPFVRRTAERLWATLPSSVELEDLVSAGTFGLLDSIEAFDPRRGVKFESFSALRIRGSMLDELRRADWVPRKARQKVCQAKQQLEQELGRPATEKELSTVAPPIAQIGSLETILLDGETRHVERGELLADARAEEPAAPLKRLDLLRRVTRGLSRQERLLVILYYFEGLTMAEIGRTLLLSESRISQMHSGLLKRLASQLSGCRLDLTQEAAA